MAENAFTCHMCGRCCDGEGGIVVSLSERERLSELFAISHREFEECYTLKTDCGTYYLATKDDGSCVFFNPGSGCGVHSVKPDICLAWPFFRGNLKDELSWRMAQDYCPGINPDVSHEEFVRQGMEHLRAHNLLHENGDGARSLQMGEVPGEEDEKDGSW